MCFRIVASGLQLIYILRVFYVRMLSICYIFIDSIISGGLIPCRLFCCLQLNNNKKVVPRITKDRLFNPFKFILAVWKSIISRESAQGTLRPIGLIPSKFFTGCKAIISIESAQWGSKDNWVNLYHFFYVWKSIISIQSAQWALSPIGLILHHFVTGRK